MLAVNATMGAFICWTNASCACKVACKVWACCSSSMVLNRSKKSFADVDEKKVRGSRGVVFGGVA